MKRCKKCVMPDTRVGIRIDEDGICLPCKNAERKSRTNMIKRFSELKDLCNRYRLKKGRAGYDCAIPLSGGKDSHYQVYVLKKILNMNPVGIMIDNGSWTKTGRANFYNLSEKLDIDIITYTPSVKDMKRATRINFFDKLHPTRAWDWVLYNKPLEIAQSLGIKLVIWGEDPSFETGGHNREETPSALKLIDYTTMYKGVKAIFLSYYVSWSRYYNVKKAKELGFKGLNDTGEWKREGFIDLFESEQVDTIGYLVNQYCKFIKFGFSNMTELCSDAIRHGIMSREEAIKIVNEHDWKLDPKMLKNFCEYIGIRESQFWVIIDKFANREILEKQDGVWRLKKDAN